MFLIPAAYTHRSSAIAIFRSHPTIASSSPAYNAPAKTATAAAATTPRAVALGTRSPTAPLPPDESALDELDEDWL